jgi:hypothetical protein
MGMRQGFADNDTHADAGTRSGTRSGSGARAHSNPGSDTRANTQYDVHGHVAGRRRLRVMFGRRGLWFQYVQGLPEAQ